MYLDLSLTVSLVLSFVFKGKHGREGIRGTGLIPPSLEGILV